jgi:hypothetical protein
MLDFLVYCVTDVCNNCQHVVSEHSYHFSIEGEFQVYEMDCMLCGYGEDSRTILPFDSRCAMSLF